MTLPPFDIQESLTFQHCQEMLLQIRRGRQAVALPAPYPGPPVHAPIDQLEGHFFQSPPQVAGRPVEHLAAQLPQRVEVLDLNHYPALLEPH